MAEEGVYQSAGDPMMGVGAGSKSYFLPVSRNYQAVAASSTAALLRNAASGAAGDYLEGLLVIPAAGTSNIGAVTIADGGGSPITLFSGGAASVSDLKPFYLPVKAKSTSGAWSVTTSTNVSVLAGGSFT